MNENKCPGLYCGRMYLENDTLSDCGACMRGYRVNDTNICTLCTGEPSSYDFLYLGFMTTMPLIMHWFFIDMAAKEQWYNKFHLLFYNN